MKSSKTYQLIKSLTKNELEEFKKRNIKNKKRIKLLLIFNDFMKTHDNFEIKEFFYEFYRVKYSKTKDNLLRNELRLLNALLENFILYKQFEKQKKESFYFNKRLYLSYLLERNVLDLFEKEIIKVFKRIDDKEDYFDFYIFFELWTRFQNKKFSYDTHYFKHSRAFYKKGILNWFKEVSFKTRKLELFISFIERTNLQIDKNVKITEPLECIGIIKGNKSNYIKFLDSKIKAFKTYNQEKLDVLLDSLEILKTVNNYYLNKANEEFSLLQSIGVEYMMHSKNEKAASFFKQVINLKGKIEKNFFIKGLYNYLNVEIKLKHFDEAISLYTKYKKEISKSYLSDIFNNVISMCYIMNNDVGKAEELTTVISSTVSPENNIYSRCNIAIIFFLNRNTDLAINELNNIRQTIKYHHHSNEAHLDFISNFKKFIHLLSVRFEQKANKDNFLLIKVNILENVNKSDDKYGGDSLHNLWLLDEIENYCN